MIRQLRRNRPLLVISIALLVFGVCLPAAAAHFHAVLTALYIVASPLTITVARDSAPRVDEQTAALLSLLLSRAPPRLT